MHTNRQTDRLKKKKKRKKDNKGELGGERGTQKAECRVSVTFSNPVAFISPAFNNQLL